MQLLKHKENKKQWKKLFSFILNLQTNCHLKFISKKWANIQATSGYNPQNQTPQEQLQSLNSSVEYPSWKYKCNINESESNTINLLF